MFKFRIPFLDAEIAAGGIGEGVTSMTSSLSVRVNRVNDRKRTFREWTREMINLIKRGDENDYGIVSRKMVTTIGVRALADCMANDSNSRLSEVPVRGSLSYHAWGTGTGAEAKSDTTLTFAAPCVEGADYEKGVSGTHVSATSGVDATLESIATITATDSYAITEHGLYWQRGTPVILFEDSSQVVLFDRSKFDPINLIAGDSIQFTYTLTIYAGDPA